MIDNTEENSLNSKEKTKCLFKEDSGKKLLFNKKNVDYDLVTRIQVLKMAKKSKI